jgi:hypothetical protein
MADLSAGTVILSLIGIALLVAVGFLWMEVRRSTAAAQQQPTKEIIVERGPWINWGPQFQPGYGPYYAHLPMRPLVY